MTRCLLGSPSGHLRWSPRLKEREEDLDHTDYRRFVLLLVEDIRQQLLYSLLSGGKRTSVNIHTSLTLPSVCARVCACDVLLQCGEQWVRL